MPGGTQHATTSVTSQRSLHNAPIFRLLLKVAVNGTHQCDFLNFCGGHGPQRKSIIIGVLALIMSGLRCWGFRAHT